ncbi:TonB-dependent hemoglobin/transferrin/lactoferrin family receptor [Oceanicola sp. 502str15]|uniref:TonB-dependent hemoglobin/transferrin/lactoferrin family receptor n=1 Tax=Oceanicola sp. 502str15 TaxID=2696061 RepID=UPI002095644B|nr:TonB-dependent hemoglobin/transferrin/lactoferrin family receptor [Oceanicola sp. 502str15]MCO6384660.1 TonB-dependent hemoglobin/transferrin/lactoferrin family receptor [Oceanicola sp. 502str15]
MRKFSCYSTTALVALAGAAQAQAQDLAFDLDPIYVESAARTERLVLDTPVAVSTLSGEALANRQAGDFQELIGDMPGVTIGGGPRAIALEPNIRGFTDDQIVLRFDGGRFNFNQGHRGRFFLDPALVKRVEVVRGGGSTLYGSGALGGVISVETVDADDLLEEGRTIGARVGMGYSTNGGQWSANTSVYADWGALDALLFLGTRDTTSNYVAGDGADIPFSELDQQNTMLKLGFEPSADSRIEFSFADYHDSALTLASANGAPSTSNPEVEREADEQSFRLSWDYAPEGNDAVDLSVLFYGDRLKITEDRVSAPRLDESTYDSLGLEVTNRSRFDLGVPVEVVYGLEVFRESQEGTRDGAPRSTFPPASAMTTGLFAEATLEMSPQFDVIAGLRYDLYKREPNDGTLEDVSEEFLSPRLGLSYRPNQNWQLFANVSRAYRAPSLSELYNDGLHFAGNPFGFPPDNFFVPNPDLKPEESTQIELGARFEKRGVRQAGDKLSFSVNVYNADVKNYIEQTVDIFAGTTTSANVDGRLWGLEAEARYDTARWFVGSGLSIARGEGDDGDWLASIPQDRLTLEAGYRPEADWLLGARATFAAAQTRVPSGGVEGEAWETLDLYAAWTPSSKAMAGSSFRVGIDNVFDQHYTIYPNELAQPGRSLEISAAFTF